MRNTLMLVGGGAALILNLLADSPRLAVFSVDLLFCGYLVAAFKANIRYLFLLHPLIMQLSSLMFEVPFIDLGDGPGYRTVIAEYVNSKTLEIDADTIFSDYSLLSAFKYMSIGAVPIMVFPEYMFGAPSSEVYYLWEGAFHVSLVALVVTLAKTWKSIADDCLLAMALFSVVSPSFFDFGVAPTRHFVTYFSVSLFYISFVAANRHMSFGNALSLAVSVILIAVSKFTLLIPCLIFSMYYIVFEADDGANFKKLMFSALVVGGALIGMEYFVSSYATYDELVSTGGATFSGLTEVPVIGWGFKYLYAILAPFPWHKAEFFIKELYGGNSLLFCMHILSALTGVYFFARLILYGKVILKENADIRPMILFGLIMSLSILRGATGFHVYLLIYFPFFAPLFKVKRYRLSYYFPIAFAMLTEGFLLVS